jgi:hypothetical protein
MRAMTVIVAAALLTGAAPAAPSKVFNGFVTDTMCGRDHASMKNSPDAKCVRDCVGDGRTYKYALLVGEQMYVLSDQETPAKFAAQQVEVTGVLYPKTGIIKVESIRAMKKR